MATLSEESLEFAKTHIEKYYDSDFFPKAFEFKALWHFWSDVKQELKGRNISKLPVSLPFVSTISKARGGFRVVHQLEPLDAIVFTAMAFEVALFVEAKREPIESKVACSYRIKIAEGSFFNEGSGWTDFKDKSEELAKENKFVAITDISDFYNQIYLHRLQNAIESSSPKLKNLANEIEGFISALNNKASQGVPVGPAASIIMAEAVMIDVDQYIAGCGVLHTRYVDDIRIFSNSELELAKAIEKLTLYLYESHRLTLATDKTRFMDSEDFVKNHLHNPYLEDREDLLEELDDISPYGVIDDGDFEEEWSEDFFADDDCEVESIYPSESVDSKESDIDLVSLGDRLSEAIQKVIEFDYIDLGLSRSIIRTARRSKIDSLISDLLDNFDYFSPVAPDIFLYLEEIFSEGNVQEMIKGLEGALNCKESECLLVRYWMEFFVSSHRELLSAPKLNRLITKSENMEHQARAAIAKEDISWVRAQKGKIGHVGGRARRAIINSARVLPSDERNHWLTLVAKNASTKLDEWLAEWVKVDSNQL